MASSTKKKVAGVRICKTATHDMQCKSGPQKHNTWASDERAAHTLTHTLTYKTLSQDKVMSLFSLLLLLLLLPLPEPRNAPIYRSAHSKPTHHRFKKTACMHACILRLHTQSQCILIHGAGSLDSPSCIYTYTYIYVCTYVQC